MAKETQNDLWVRLTESIAIDMEKGTEYQYSALMRILQPEFKNETLTEKKILEIAGIVKDSFVKMDPEKKQALGLYREGSGPTSMQMGVQEKFKRDIVGSMRLDGTLRCGSLPCETTEVRKAKEQEIEHKIQDEIKGYWQECRETQIQGKYKLKNHQAVMQAIEDEFRGIGLEKEQVKTIVSICYNTHKLHDNKASIKNPQYCIALMSDEEKKTLIKAALTEIRKDVTLKDVPLTPSEQIEKLKEEKQPWNQKIEKANKGFNPFEKLKIKEYKKNIEAIDNRIEQIQLAHREKLGLVPTQKDLGKFVLVEVETGNNSKTPSNTPSSSKATNQSVAR